LKRKLIYLAIIFAILFLVGGASAYVLFHEEPTCFDTKQNEKEDGVDCGGPCRKLCTPLEIMPLVLWQRSFKITPGVYSAVAYIENRNRDAEGINVPYRFTIYDADNVMIAEREGVTYIPPGQTFAVFEPNIALGTQIPTRTEFSFDKNLIWYNVAKKKQALEAKNIELIEEGKFPALEADIVNPGTSPYGRFQVVAILYDTNGNAFTASQTALDGLSAESSARVRFTWPLPFDQKVTKKEVITVAR
jgi:hypothetical protein